MSWMCDVILSSPTRKNTAVNHTAPIHGTAVCFYYACCRSVGLLSYGYNGYPVTEPVNSNTANTDVRYWTMMTVSPFTFSKVILQSTLQYFPLPSSRLPHDFGFSYPIYTPVNNCDLSAVMLNNNLHAETPNLYFLTK
jgi:hypothetical protein